MKPKDLGTAFELRRGEVERINKAGAQFFTVNGTIEANGPGEMIVSVNFPVLFVNKPSLSFGCELAPGQPVVATNLPTGNLTVVQWGQKARADGTIIYSGASFGLVTTGPAGQVMFIQWTVEGTGLRGPNPAS